MTSLVVTERIREVERDIVNNFPNFVIEEIRSIGEGMDSQAFLVNKEWIFRFPKRESVSNNLKTEIDLLPELQKILQVRIPDFKYIGKQTKNNYWFVGYKMIGGVELSEQVFSQMDKIQKEVFMAQIAVFLKSIHSFPLEQAVRSGVKFNDLKSEYEGDLRILRESVYKLLDQNIIDYIENLFERYLSNSDNFVFKPVLLHADFSSDHIFLNNVDGKIEGVIDFGDMTIGDPDYDLLYLYEELGKSFIENLLGYYPHSNPKLLFEKLELYYRLSSVGELLQGVERSDDELIQNSILNLKAESKNYI